VRCVRDRKAVLYKSLLGCATVLALFARLYFASRPEVGLDDATSADIAALPVASLIRFVMWNEPTMGLYYVLLHFWSAIAGNRPLALRVLSILCSVATVPAIYLLGCRLFNSGVGLTAAFLLATNATAVDFAQTIRSYSLVILLAVASSISFVKLMELPKAKIMDSWPYIISSTLAVYTHMHATFILIAHAFSACLRRTVPWRTLIVSGVTVGLVVLPLPLVTLGHYQGQSDWVTQVKLVWMGKVMPFLSGAPLLTKTPSAILLTLSTISLAAIGAFAIDFSLWSRTFTVNGLVVPIGLCALLSLVKPAFFGESRYLLICLPFLVLLVALGIGTFRRPVIILSAVMVLEIWQVVLRPLQYQTPTNRSYWSEATDYLFSTAKPGDRVVVSWKYDAWLYWYYEALQDKNHTRLRLVFPNWDATGFKVNGIYVDNNAVPQHPSAKWFQSDKTHVGRLWTIIDSSHDSTTEQLLASVRGLHTETQRTFPDGLKVILSEAESSQ
jgi:Dolichyl-phosphate-mannose-protein mannosyltransferase